MKKKLPTAEMMIMPSEPKELIIEMENEKLLQKIEKAAIEKSESLFLGENQLTSLPPEIGKLTKLTKLNLSRNQLASLPPEIGKLTNLAELSLVGNQLTSLPLEIEKLTNLAMLDLGENPLPIPPEILNKTDEPATIINYYLQFQRDWKEPLNEAKMLLVGQGSVGKTSLVRRLTENKFDHENKTEGINIKKWQLPVDDQNIRLNVWDFGGQEIMHATHQFFLTKRSLYLLILDSRLSEEDNRLEYWIRIIQSFGGDSPVIIVSNKTDQHLPDLDRRGLRNKYTNIRGFAETSCKNGYGIDKLKELITREISSLEHIRNQLITSWFAVKNQLENMKENYISYQSFQDICQKENIRDSLSQKTLIGFLHDLGIVLNFQDPRLEETNILNPEWITSGVYSIINSNELFQSRGVLKLNTLNRILDAREYPRDKHLFIIDMMRKFELCFDFADGKFLIPDLLSKEEPYTGEWDDALKFQYHYNILPGSVISRFLVRMHAFIHKETYWNGGAVLAYEENRALVRADKEDKKIFISISGPIRSRRIFLAVIRSNFDSIHKTLAKIEAKEKLPLPDNPNNLIDYNHLLHLEKKGVKYYIPEGTDEEISVRQLINSISAEEEKELKSGANINENQNNIGYPFSFLNEAIKAVPSVKWALGTGSIISTIAIAGSFSFGPRIAGYGTLILAILAAALIISSRVTSFVTDSSKKLPLVLTWFSLILFIAVSLSYCSSVFYKWPADLSAWTVEATDINIELRRYFAGIVIICVMILIDIFYRTVPERLAWQRQELYPEWAENVLTSLRKSNSIKIKKFPRDHRDYISKTFFRDHDHLNLFYDRSKWELRFNNMDRMNRFSKIWDQALNSLNTNNMDEFQTIADNMTNLLCKTLGFKQLANSESLNQLFGQMIDSSNAAFQLNIRSKFPFFYICSKTFTEQDVHNAFGMLNQFEIYSNYFGVFIAFATDLKLREKVKKSAFKNDFIVLNRDQIWEILGAKSPDQRFSDFILNQVDLTTVSPYIVAGPVHPKIFFGRTQEQKTLLQNIPQNNYALIANRKMGKTSLLNKVTPSLHIVPHYHVLYSDLQAVDNYDSFFATLVENYEEIHGINKLDKKLTPSDLHRIMKDIKKDNDKKIIMIFDEVDELLNYDLSHNELLFKTFRTLSQSGYAHFIFSGSEMLIKRVRNPGSPLFNFCEVIKIGCLDETSAEQLVTEPMQTIDVKFEDIRIIVDRIVNITACHPNIIQYTCSKLIQKINKETEKIIRKVHLEEVVNSTEFFDYFEQLIWGQSTALEKLIVFALWNSPGFDLADVITKFKNMNIPTENVENSLETLEIYSILNKKKNKYSFVYQKFGKLIEEYYSVDDLLEIYKEKLQKVM